MEALLTGNEENIAEEAGDVAQVLFHVLRGSCPNHQSLIRVMEDAVAKCEARSVISDGSC